jgi:hypothetical protein
LARCHNMTLLILNVGMPQSGRDLAKEPPSAAISIYIGERERHPIFIKVF